MEWACEHCGRTFRDPPADVCPTCGRATVVPGGGEGADSLTAHLEKVRRSLLDPTSLDGTLTAGGPAVTVAFRVVLAVSLALALVFLAALLL